MRIGQKVRFTGGSKAISKDNVFLNDDRLHNKILTISRINANGDISLLETDHGFARDNWLHSIFAPAIVMSSNIKVL